jgi:hypothetical protein
MDDTATKTDAVPDALRALAEKLDAFVEPDLRAVTGWTPATVVSYRKRGVLESVKVGKHYLYLRQPILERITSGKPRVNVAKAVL